MGTKKNKILDSIKEGDQLAREAIDAGEQLEGDGSEIKSLLDGIDTSMDEDDISAVRAAESSYSSDFKAAFKENVDTKAEDVKRRETDASAESSAELEKVSEAADKFREMAGISEVGRRNAEGGADVMNRSAAEYKEYIDEANRVIDDTKSDVDSLRDSIDSIFG